MPEDETWGRTGPDMAPLLFVSFETMLGAMFRRLFILSLSLLAMHHRPNWERWST
jgi:hypothetical protein